MEIESKVSPLQQHMGIEVTTANHTEQQRKNSRPAVRRPAPASLADVALIDGPSIAAAGCMAVSAWLQLVRNGAAPQPVIRQPRYTRWRLADARAWLIERAAQQMPDKSAAVVAHAKRASAKAREPAAVERAKASRKAGIAARAAGAAG